MKVPAQMRVRVWMTIHLCSKELEEVSRMVRKISLKNTCSRGREGWEGSDLALERDSGGLT